MKPPLREGKTGEKCFLRHFLRGQLVLPGRQLVRQARQQLAHPAHIPAHVADGVDDLSVFDQRQVAVAAHGLQIQLPWPFFPQLVPVVDHDADQPVPKELLDAHHPAADQVLAQKHAEHRGVRRVLVDLVGQVDARHGGAGRDQQAAVFPLRADQQHHHVLFRLADPVDPASRQRLHFPGQKAHRQSVQRHKSTSVVFIEFR